MSNKQITVLDPIVADQIAAGEVVERPASVIKELVENSLDAGATKVRVEVDGGGAARMRVLDDGMGIPADQLEMAFMRHATSKINHLSDLDTLLSYGFRGEALPSIASVSKILVHSRVAEAAEGVRLELEAGKLVDRRVSGTRVGTDMEIRELFFNTPARLKFLKKDTTEMGHCSEALLRLALIRPDVSFELVSGGRTTRQLSKVAQIEERVASLFPGEHLVLSEGSEMGIEVLAVLGPPERARAGTGSLYTYVNGRFVRDKLLFRAVNQALSAVIPGGRYPAGLISLTLPAGSFDVNVHPQKSEVRFSNEKAVFRAVGHVVGSMVARSAWSLIGTSSAQEAVEPYVQAESQEIEKPVMPAPERAPVTAPQTGTNFIAPPSYDKEQLARPTVPVRADYEPAPKREQISLSNPKFEERSGRFQDMQLIGQAKGIFLLCEDANDLVVVDQHAAHERVTYERLRAQLSDGGVAVQKLLVPVAVDLGPAEVERIDEMSESLERLGLEASRTGPDRVTIYGVPAVLSEASPTRLLADMVIALDEERSGSKGELDDHIVTMACHTSIRGGQVIGRSEVKALLEEMDKIDFAGHCPHGRPVLTRIPWSEIKKRVGRG